MSTSEAFARIVFQSPLPALNREFEYSVPDSLRQDVRVGQRVKVHFAGQSKEGFIVSLVNEPTFKGKLSQVIEIVSPIPVLQPHIYELLQAIAARQCCSVGELLPNAIPKRSVRVEKSFSANPPSDKHVVSGSRYAELVSAVANEVSGVPNFVARIRDLASKYFEENQSVIICVPDFRDLGRVKEALTEVIPKDALLEVDSNDVGSQRYLSFLQQQTDDTKVVIGTRNVMYSPISADAAIIVWDDGDQSHQDQQSPYLNTREIALIRQDLFSSPLHFLSHSRSTEIQRLVNIGYLEDSKSSAWKPKIALSDGRGLDGMAFKLIKRALESGPVLVQVASPGSARSLYCADCSERSMCIGCNGPLWLNSKGQIVCRWCGQMNLEFVCRSCGHKALRQSGAGSTKWVEQLGKSFPGVSVREVTAQTSDHTVPNRPSIVVCTAGIEPIALGGYAGVVLLDCAVQLNHDSLKAPEDALRSWLNAISFMRSTGEAVAVGVSEEVSKALSLGQIRETLSEMLKERELLGFPPTRRFLSGTGSREVVEELAMTLSNIEGLRVLGIADSVGNAAEGDVRLVASFAYAQGGEVSTLVRDFLASVSSKQTRTSAKSGRSIRPLSVKFDDPRVI